VLGWGSTYGAIMRATLNLIEKGHSVACTHLRYLNPFPNDMQALLESYPQRLVVENNTGQLWLKLRGELLLDTEKLTKIEGTPFKVREIEDKILSMLGEKS